MIYRHVFVLASVLLVIRREVGRHRWTETGGPLAGYVSEDHALVVTHAAGPGRRGQRNLFSVVIDGADAQAFCDAVYRESGGLFDYVGDWHRHVGWSLNHSRRDTAAMRQVAEHEHCPIQNPVSLIYRTFPEKFVVYVLNDEQLLEPVVCSTLLALPG